MILKIKYVIILTTLTIISLHAKAQRDTSFYYLKNSGKVVQTKDSADYLLLIVPPDTSINKDLFILKAYYLNGKPRFVGGSLSSSVLKFQGNFINYFPNGHRMSLRAYNNGMLTGDAIEYYPNGKFYCKQSYVKVGANGNQQLLKDCSDSTGNVLAKDGNGSWILFNDAFSRITEQGRVVNGLKDSVWKVLKTDTSGFLNDYKKGKLLSSKYYRILGGQTVIYEPGSPDPYKESVPEFVGGIDAFQIFLTRNIRYPAEARKNGTQGKVVISFVVEKDGTLTDIKVAQRVGDGCDEEAVRVVRLSPPWKLAMQNGKPVRSAYSFPITFSLSN